MQDDVRKLVANWSRSMQNSMKSSGIGMVEHEEAANASEAKVSGLWEYRVLDEGTPEARVTITRCMSDDADLAVPAELEGLPVAELARHAFRGKLHLEHLVLPDTISRVGEGCFMNCRSLKSLVLPDAVDRLDGTVFSACASLSQVHLPASLREIPAHLLSSCPLEVCCIPRDTVSIAHDAFNTRALRRLEVDRGNTSFSTDGIALFDPTGSRLTKAFVPVASYTVPSACEVVGSGAFKSMPALEHVDLGQSLRSIEDFAFFHTGLVELVCPDSLEEIGEKAFMGSKIAAVFFNDTLQSIGAMAFAQTSLVEARLPKSLRRLGRGAFSKLASKVSAADALSVDPENPVLSFDGSAVYARDDEKQTLIEFMDNAEAYSVVQGTEAIGVSAFEGSRKLRVLTLPESLRTIGDRAFYGCRTLSEVTFPLSLESIGESAFYNTPLQRVAIPPNVSYIGRDAFAVSDGTMGEYNTANFELEVSADNTKYYVCDETLIERGEEGDTALLFTGGADAVRLPETVTRVAGGAFRNAVVSELFIPAGLKDVSQSSFFGLHGLSTLHVAFPSAVGGADQAHLLFPPRPRDPWDMSRTLVTDEDGLFLKFSDYDEQIVHEKDVGLVVRIAVSRLSNPIKLSESAQAKYHSALNQYLDSALEQYVLQDDVAGMRLVYDCGLIDSARILELLELAEEQDAQEIKAYLSSIRG